VIHRLTAGGPENSGQFRLYTWRGTIDMAKAHFLIGTGPDTFMDYYPRYALAGFTRLAHETYLQVAAEIGVPALMLMGAAFGALLAILWRSLGRFDAHDASGPMSKLADLPSSAYPSIAAGLLAGLVAEFLQNLIDSDLYVFAIGLTFWAFAGLASGLSDTSDLDEKSVRSTSPALKWAAAVILLAAAVFSAMNGIAAADVAQADTILSTPNGSAVDAAAAYRSAESLAPLDGKYPAEFGFRVLIQRQGDKVGGIADVKRGVQLQPDSQNYLRLGSALENAGDTAGAIAAYRDGLRADPNRLELLLAIARLSPPDQALAYYRKIADLEQSPVGKVRAIGEVTEQRFAVGDSAVADDAAKRGDTRDAIDYYRRAIGLLEKYADEDGSSFPERAASSGGMPMPENDQQSAALYDHVSSALLGLLSGKDHDAFAAEKQFYQAEFDAVVGDAFKAIGRASDAKTAYQNAQSALTGCTYWKAAKLKQDLDSKIPSLGQ
jgi:tetratricopeptide (TPR) repeat protein